MLGGDLTVVQASVLDSVSFDPFSFHEDGLATSEVDVGRCQITPRRPSRTIRIFSSAEYCLRVARRMVFISRSDGELPVTDFCLICAPRRTTMSQKSSLPQLAKSVSMALIPDKASTGG
jgi:hypothetical protein